MGLSAKFYLNNYFPPYLTLPGVLMFLRLDSGDPVETVMSVLKLLEEKFGGIITNSKGYKQLPSYLKLIQGIVVIIN